VSKKHEIQHFRKMLLKTTKSYGLKTLFKKLMQHLKLCRFVQCCRQCIWWTWANAATAVIF